MNCNKLIGWHYIFCLSLLLSGSCSPKKGDTTYKSDSSTPKEVVSPSIQAILDTAKVSGSILIYDQNKDQYYSNDFAWARKSFLPASTFKIANSIIALETGVVENEKTIFKWDGQPRGMEIWEKDLSLKDAFHASCVPCYQEIARSIGSPKMKEYLSLFGYGNMVFDSTTIDNFWLMGASRISQFQQIDFLRHLQSNELPISRRTDSLFKSMMIVENQNKRILRAKTGLSITNGNMNGWYVGYLVKDDNNIFFATNIIPSPDQPRNEFIRYRESITRAALKSLSY